MATEYNTIWGGDVEDADLLQDLAKVELAKEEGDKYIWSRVPESDFLTMYYPEADACFVVRSKDGRSGCSCDYFKSSGTACEHLIALKKVDVAALPESPSWLIAFLSSSDWKKIHGKECPPATEMAATPGQATPKPEPPAEPKPKKKVEPEVVGEVTGDGKVNTPKAKPASKRVSITCTYCGLKTSRKTQEEVDAWIRDHHKTCHKNPDNQKAPEPEPEPPAPESKPEAKAKAKGKSKPDPEPDPKETSTDTAVSTDVKMPTDGEFQRAQVQRILENQGKIYKAAGKQVPDSAAVQNYAVSRGISMEILLVEQTDEYAKAIVRAHRGDLYADASVILRRDAIEAKFLIDLAEKHPAWVSDWQQGLPQFYLNQKVTVGEKVRVLGLYIAGACIDKWLFAGRDAETKAMRRAEIKVLGVDWRENDEVQSEEDEMAMVANSKKKVT